MNCPDCKRPMEALDAPPSRRVYICQHVSCGMADAITEVTA